MPFLKSIWKGSSKHKKLCDEQDLTSNQDYDDEFSQSRNSYNVKYIGYIPVDCSDNTKKVTENAIDSLLNMKKSKSKRSSKVTVFVSIKGIEVTDSINEKHLFEVSIFKICNCISYTKSKRVFGFLATNNQGMTECHAFICPSKSLSESIALTVAQKFSTMYAMCQTPRQSVSNYFFPSNPWPGYETILDIGGYKLKDSTPSLNISKSKWTSFDGSLQEDSLHSPRSVACAEVYTSPPALISPAPSLPLIVL